LRESDPTVGRSVVPEQWGPSTGWPYERSDFLVANPILVALDVPTSDEAFGLASLLKEHVGGFKVGLELFMGPGPDTVRRIAEFGLPIFCDVKLHDIPNTVRKASQQLGGLGARWITVHASGGAAQLEAAVEGLAEGAGGRPAGVLGVTVLTSLSTRDLEQVGVGDGTENQVARLTRLAASAGAEGVICAPVDLPGVSAAGPELLKVTPGIRPTGIGVDDHARAATPEAAIAAGADYLVIGRAITLAIDPVAAADEIARSIQMQRG
jgi:orotidine-5'-phosphate decarboxylase